MLSPDPLSVSPESASSLSGIPAALNLYNPTIEFYLLGVHVHTQEWKRNIKISGKNDSGIKAVFKSRIFHGTVFYSLLTIALAGPLVFLAVSTLLPFLNQGYNLVYDAVSALVFGAYGWLQTVGFYSFGVSLLALASVVFIKTRMKLNAGTLALAFTGICFLLIGAFKGHGPGQPPGLSGVIHLVFVGMLVVAFPAACFLMAPRLKAWGHHVLRFYTIAVGIFATLFMIIGGPVLALQYSLTGIFERVLLWNGMLWVLLVGSQLLIHDIRQRRSYAYAIVEPDQVIEENPADRLT